MADYFQDILPPEGEQRKTPPPTPPQQPEPAAGERSIRNINIARRAPSPAAERSAFMPPMRSSFFASYKLWLIAAVALVVLALLGLFALRKTTVTVVPRTHTIVFDNTAPFTAYPAESAASGTLPYEVQTFTFEDSEVVPSSGTQHVETKASGSITVYNNATAAPFKLLANTRFETPEGLIYKSPSEVVIPGKKGSTPGQVSITVVADQVGEKYNVGPVAKFTLPGLKGGDTFATIYASSNAAFSGGFAGEQPQTAPGALEGATAQIRSRLEAKVRDAIANIGADKTALSDLARTSYADLPNAPEGTGNVRIRQQATVQVPVFSTPVLAANLAQSVSADAAKGGVQLIPQAGFAAQYADVASTTLGADPIAFTLSGTAQLVWQVDKEALAGALAGHDQGAFETIIGGFPFVQEAKARIEPFWSSSFPKDPSKIVVSVSEAPKP